MALIGYARVSTSVQDTQLQLDALDRAGVEVVYSEKTSSVGKRPELQRAMAALRRGDVLVVWKTDRLARSLRDLLSMLDKLYARGCMFRSLTEPIDTSSPLGEFMLQVLGAVAQLERAMIRERVLAGQIAAYQRGKRWGGAKPKLSDLEAAELRRQRKAGAKLWELAESWDLAPSTVSNYLNPRPRIRPRLPVLGPLLSSPVE